VTLLAPMFTSVLVDEQKRVRVIIGRVAFSGTAIRSTRADECRGSSRRVATG
jgi:hypothetical protein